MLVTTLAFTEFAHKQVHEQLHYSCVLTSKWNDTCAAHEYVVKNSGSLTNAVHTCVNLKLSRLDAFT